MTIRGRSRSLSSSAYIFLLLFSLITVFTAFEIGFADRKAFSDLFSSYGRPYVSFWLPSEHPSNRGKKK